MITLVFRYHFRIHDHTQAAHGTIKSIHYNGTVSLWWEMRLHEDLLTFDKEGMKRMIEFGDGGLHQPMGIVLHNIELFLNDVLEKTKFDFSKGTLHLNKERVQRLIATFPSNFNEDWTF